MGSKVFLRILGIVTAILILLPGLSHTLAAQPFMGEKEIVIETRYSQKTRDVMGSVVNWHLSTTIMENGYSIGYLIEGKELFCSLMVDTSHPILAVTLSGSTNNIIDKTSGAFIPFVGFPAPCRIFKIKEFSQPGKFKVIREAGNRRFSNEFFFEILPVSVEEALVKGWLNSSILSDKKEIELVMVSVKNTAGEVLFTQLWDKDSDWWLYEETESSKSWKKD